MCLIGYLLYFNNIIPLSYQDVSILYMIDNPGRPQSGPEGNWQGDPHKSHGPQLGEWYYLFINDDSDNDSTNSNKGSQISNNNEGSHISSHNYNSIASDDNDGSQTSLDENSKPINPNEGSQTPLVSCDANFLTLVSYKENYETEQLDSEQNKYIINYIYKKSKDYSSVPIIPKKSFLTSFVSTGPYINQRVYEVNPEKRQVKYTDLVKKNVKIYFFILFLINKFNFL